MIILPSNIWILPVFQQFLQPFSLATTDKPVNRSIQAYALTQLNVFALRGFIFRDIHKKQGRSSSNSGYEIQKICGWKIYSRTRTFGAEVHKSNIRVKRWHTKYESSELLLKDTTFVEIICLPSPIVLKYRLIKQRNELLGHPVYGKDNNSFLGEAGQFFFLGGGGSFYPSNTLDRTLVRTAYSLADHDYILFWDPILLLCYYVTLVLSFKTRSVSNYIQSEVLFN